MAQTTHLTTGTGVGAVIGAVSEYQIAAEADGLEFASPANTPDWFPAGIQLSERLIEFLTDVRLLRRIPLSYLVPDAKLLPPESIRFFYVNQMWVDRVIDGVVSNTNLGTVDFHRSLTVLQAIREQAKPAAGQMTGMLIRSELVRRWPRMTVRAFSNTNAKLDAESNVPVLRNEPISRDVYIALFDGVPVRVHLREPFDGVRFGVEAATNGQYSVDRRQINGDPGSGTITVTFRNAERRTIDVGKLADDIVDDSGVADPRQMALHLEQRPYVQVFTQSTGEAQGSRPAPQFLNLRHGRQALLTFQTQALFGAGND